MMRLVCLRQESFWFLLLAVPNVGIIPVASFLSSSLVPCHHHHHAVSSIPAFFSRLYGNNENQFFSIHVVTTNDVILPGERTSLALTDEEAIPLIQNCLQDDPLEDQPSRVALAVCVEEQDWQAANCDDEEEELSLAQIASLCDTVGMNVGKHDDQVQMDLQCVGRIRLLKMEQQYSTTHFRFRGEWIQEGFQDNDGLKKARRMENNIHALMKHVSQMEQQVLSTNHSSSPNKLRMFGLSNQHPDNIQLYDNFTETNAKVTGAISKAFWQGLKNHNSSSAVEQHNGHVLLRLTAMSWAVFLCLNNERLEAKYRLQALDWDNLLERIKLAQYVLREKQLLLQGKLMEMDSESTRNSNPIIAAAVDQDAFQ